jgi:hypothetical protein
VHDPRRYQHEAPASVLPSEVMRPDMGPLLALRAGTVLPGANAQARGDGIRLTRLARSVGFDFGFEDSNFLAKLRAVRLELERPPEGLERVFWSVEHDLRLGHS